jgi:hypothetical protein
MKPPKIPLPRRVCPNPEKKIREVTREAAQRRIDNAPEQDRDLEVYECSCGMFHLRGAGKLARKHALRRAIANQLAADLQAIADEALAGLPDPPGGTPSATPTTEETL